MSWQNTLIAGLFALFMAVAGFAFSSVNNRLDVFEQFGSPALRVQIAQLQVQVADVTLSLNEAKANLNENTKRLDLVIQILASMRQKPLDQRGGRIGESPLLSTSYFLDSSVCN